MRMLAGWMAYLLVPCALFLVPASGVAADAPKMGYVNLGKIFDNYQRTKASEQALQQQGKQKQAELEARVTELKTLRKHLDVLSEQAREAKTKELEEKSDELQRLKTRAERDFLRERNRMAQTILQEIQQTVADYARANGFSLVMDQRTVLYGADTYDLTDEILKALNDRAATKAPAAAGAAKPAAAKP